jgi:nicotinic acid mononucleotide adenylyltransferase
MCRTQIDTEQCIPPVDLPGKRMRHELYVELRMMAELYGLLPCEDPFELLYRKAERALTHIDMMLHYGMIRPFREFRTQTDQPAPDAHEHSMRVGIYPVTANPLHWAHVLIGLDAMAKLRLDKVVYVIAGNDVRKPDLIEAEIRYAMARGVLMPFEPYFSCSDIALGTDVDGETNLLRLLELNDHQRITAFYIAGSDHCRRVYPDSGYPDTIGKLERFCQKGFFNTDTSLHSVTAAFIMRDHQVELVQTTLPTITLDGMPFSISSTMIREVLCGKGSDKALAFLPHSVYTALKTMDVYRDTDFFPSASHYPRSALAGLRRSAVDCLSTSATMAADGRPASSNHAHMIFS